MSNLIATIWDKMSSLMDDIDFSYWLELQLTERNWTQSELSRRSGVSRQIISTYIKRQRLTPEPQVLVSIARAFHLPPEVVFRAAGVLPLEPDDPLVDKHKQIIEMLKEVGDDEADDLVIALLHEKLKQKFKLK